MYITVRTARRIMILECDTIPAFMRRHGRYLMLREAVMILLQARIDISLVKIVVMKKILEAVLLW